MKLEANVFQRKRLLLRRCNQSQLCRVYKVFTIYFWNLFCFSFFHVGLFLFTHFAPDTQELFTSRRKSLHFMVDSTFALPENRTLFCHYTNKTEPLTSAPLHPLSALSSICFAPTTLRAYISADKFCFSQKEHEAKSKSFGVVMQPSFSFKLVRLNFKCSNDFQLLSLCEKVWS